MTNPDPATLGCEDYARAAGLSRRGFLQGMAAASASAVATTMFGDALRQASFGATAGGNVLVVISLRGGIDGLGMVVPHGDPGYYRARPRIAVPSAALVAKDPMFGLHPAMAPLEWLFGSGELAAVHAVGMPRPNRSHFLAMEEVEDADPTSSVRRGWVNRMVGLDADAQPVEAVHLGSGLTPTLLVGEAPTLAATDLDKAILTGTTGGWGTRRRRHIRRSFAADAGPLGDAARSALSTVSTLAPVISTGYQPTVSYPRDWPSADLSDALKDTARLIKADLGTEVVSIDYGSWDMHAEYGNVDTGDMQAMTRGFASVLDAFLRDLGTLRQRVTVVTVSEFGRRVAENGNRGLDHGWGNMMLVAGAGVRGGRYYGRWPGLGTDKLVDGDLEVTTDYRDVLGEVVTSRFPDRSIGSVFPGLVHRPLGLMG